MKNLSSLVGLRIDWLRSQSLEIMLVYQDLLTGNFVILFSIYTDALFLFWTWIC